MSNASLTKLLKSWCGIYRLSWIVVFFKKMSFYDLTKEEEWSLKQNVLLSSFIALKVFCRIHQRIKNWVLNRNKNGSGSREARDMKKAFQKNPLHSIVCERQHSTCTIVQKSKAPLSLPVRCNSFFIFFIFY